MDIKSLEGKSAFDLFPDIIRDIPKKKKASPLIPPPPDLSWLTEGMAERNPAQPGNSLAALVAIAEDHKRAVVKKVLEKMGYAIDTALSAEYAIQKLQVVQYKLIICGTDAAFKDIHQHICGLPSPKRRVTYYAIVGPNLHTLYNLEALALSANLVINDRDLQYLEKILGKGFRDYENLFRPLLDILNVKTSSF
jgi:hypothetical protein